MSILEIETAITKLPRKEVAALVTWLDDYHERLWDDQILENLNSGKLDSLLESVDKEYEAGLAKPL